MPPRQWWWTDLPSPVNASRPTQTTNPQLLNRTLAYLLKMIESMGMSWWRGHRKGWQKGGWQVVEEEGSMAKTRLNGKEKPTWFLKPRIAYEWGEMGKRKCERTNQTWRDAMRRVGAEACCCALRAQPGSRGADTAGTLVCQMSHRVSHGAAWLRCCLTHGCAHVIACRRPYKDAQAVCMLMRFHSWILETNGALPIWSQL